LVGLTSFLTTSFLTKNQPVLPKLNSRRAKFVLTKIDEILTWSVGKKQSRTGAGWSLGVTWRGVRAGQYWRLENLKVWIPRPFSAAVATKEDYGDGASSEEQRVVVMLK
jgi:hypothetical protein